jgi:hypothetical protein
MDAKYPAANHPGQRIRPPHGYPEEGDTSPSLRIFRRLIVADVVRVEQPAQILLGVRHEMPIGRIDLGHGRAPDPAQVEELDAGRDRPGGKRVPTRIDTAMLDTRRRKGWLPVRQAEGLEFEVAVVVAGEDEGLSEPPWSGVERSEHLRP